VTEIEVEIEVLDESGAVVKVVPARVESIRASLCFLQGESVPYCLSPDECEGYWCCDPSSGVRLSKASVEACRKKEAP
jgi:hypothetical protein